MEVQYCVSKGFPLANVTSKYHNEMFVKQALMSTESYFTSLKKILAKFPRKDDPALEFPVLVKKTFMQS